ERKTDYYYHADQIPRGELEKLTPADQREFAALEAHAGETLAELKDGFKAIDKIRLEINKTRNASGAERQTAAQITDRADGAIKYDSLQKRDLNLDQERTNDRRLLGDVIIKQALADCAAFDYEMARDYGHTFRFSVHDESLEANRRISRLDGHRRAGARGDRP